MHRCIVPFQFSMCIRPQGVAQTLCWICWRSCNALFSCSHISTCARITVSQPTVNINMSLNYTLCRSWMLQHWAYMSRKLLLHTKSLTQNQLEKLFMSMHAFVKWCVMLAHAQGTPAKLTVWILSPPLAAAFGQIVPMPSTIAHTSHNCGTPCNHIILCMDMLWNTLQACPINPCLANISLSRLLWHTHLTHSHLLQSAREIHACAEQFTSNVTIKLK